jgi:hypothetical protein
MIKDLAKAVLEQEQHYKARRKRGSAEGKDSENHPADFESGSTRDSSKNKE